MTHTADENAAASKVRPTKEKNFGHNLRKYLREYTEVTGIHGLRYVTEKRSRVEKVVWAVLLLLSLAGCIYMIYEILEKYKNSPVVVSFATEDTPLYQIPFPAVTICPETKYSKDFYDYNKLYLEVKDNKTIDPEDFKVYDHLSLLCSANDSDRFCSQNIGNDVFETFQDVRLEPFKTIPMCFLYEKNEDCEKILTPVIIDEGMCYSFNVLDRKEIFKKHVYHYENYYQVDEKSNGIFDFETGYKKGAGVNPYPRRAMMSGADNSLMLFFMHSPKNTDFLCNKIYQGFRVSIHNSWDVPRLSKHYFRVPLNKVVVVAMEPEVVKTSESVRKFSPEKRKCFMKDERPLLHFNYYTQPNCLLECLTNHTLSQCGCLKFFMPRDNGTKICGAGKYNCTEEAENDLKIKELESRISGEDFCNCKPSCTSIKYNVETSHSDFYFKEFFVAQEMRAPHFDEFQWSVMQIYFKHEHFMTVERNELYGITDLISNLGGLLGLFTGLSMISVLEIVYFCSLRIFYNERLYGLWSGPPS